MSLSLADELTGTTPLPRLPGAGRGRGPLRSMQAVLIDVQLEGFGIHTRRHFGGRLETHPFFSREALHSALMDLWTPTAPRTRQPITIPYGSTPLWANDPEIMELHYNGPRGFLHQNDPRRRIDDLSQGTMEGMVPGTVLRAALWGEPDALPPDLEEGRGFYIGKGRAPCTVMRAEAVKAPIERGKVGPHTLPIQVSNEVLRAGMPGIAFRTLARAPWYSVVELAPGCTTDFIEVSGVRVPLLAPNP